LVSLNTGTRVGPIYVERNAVTGAIEALQLTPFWSKPGTDSTVNYSGKRQIVAPEQYNGLCALGHSVAVLPRPVDGTKSQSFLKAIPASTSVPSSFSIAIYYGIVLGNFWVPATMPESHNAHLVDFTVNTNNFQYASSGTHFVNTQMTVSDSNFASDFDAKGLYFGLDGTFCGSSTSPVFTSVAETWTIQTTPQTYTNVQVWDGTPSPDTCAAMSYGQSYRFFAGANRSQKSVYWRYFAGAATPHYVSPEVNSYDPKFRNGGAGVGFLVAAPSTYPGEYWYLSFTNVASWTQP